MFENNIATENNSPQNFEQSSPGAKPLIGIVTCNRSLHEQPFHASPERYSVAIMGGCNAIPVLIPSMKNIDIFQHLSGILFTGSVSNIEPHHYNGHPSRPGTLHDPQRDEVSFFLMKEAIKRNLPFLAICRGNQELNVTMGGSLHQNVHELPHRQIHHEDLSVPLPERFLPAHPAQIRKGGLLEKILGRQEIMVNTLHHQAICKLGKNLQVEATAPDGTIEAVSIKSGHHFGLGIQWHPEWRIDEYPLHQKIFNAFGQATYNYFKTKIRSVEIN